MFNMRVSHSRYIGPYEYAVGTIAGQIIAARPQVDNDTAVKRAMDIIKITQELSHESYKQEEAKRKENDPVLKRLEEVRKELRMLNTMKGGMNELAKKKRTQEEEEEWTRLCERARDPWDVKRYL